MKSGDAMNKLIAKLVRGKKYASQLQDLLTIKPSIVENNNSNEGLRSSVDELAGKIFRSFDVSLAELSCSGEGCQIGAGDGCRSFQYPGESHKSQVKYRRGCYKRKRTQESWTEISARTEDGYAWRKYGQKVILNTIYPRCYYRCTHKYAENCGATKQVQKVDNNDYKTTYFGHHTCQSSSSSSSLLLLNNNNNKEEEEEEDYETTTTRTQSDLTDNKSSVTWQDLIASGSPYEVVSEFDMPILGTGCFDDFPF